MQEAALHKGVKVPYAAPAWKRISMEEVAFPIRCHFLPEIQFKYAFFQYVSHAELTVRLIFPVVIRAGPDISPVINMKTDKILDTRQWMCRPWNRQGLWQRLRPVRGIF